MKNWYKKRLVVSLLTAVTVMFFAATAFGAIGNQYLLNNMKVFPGLITDITNPVTNPVVPMGAADWVNQEVWIEAPVDVDMDGKRDLLLFAYGIPASAQASPNYLTTPLLLCPTLINVTPYTGNSVPNQYIEPYNYQILEPKVDGPWPGENNPSTMHYTYEDVENTRKLYKDVLAANFKPDWLPAERTTMFVEREGTARFNSTPPGAVGWAPYFRARGYAYGSLFMLGNANAEGFCTNKTYDEALGSASVIDWLNGRVKAYRYPYPVRLATPAELANNASFDNAPSNLSILARNTNGSFILDNKYIRDDVNGGYVEVKAYWATGDAVMSGQSYNGALPLMAMTTGVEGLKVVIPFASVAGSYEYYRTNGTPTAPGTFQGEDIPEYFPYCGGRMYTTNAVRNPLQMGNNEPRIWDNYYIKLSEAMAAVERETGSYNSFYDERNLVKYVDDAKGIVILWHGFNDLNVKFKNGAIWYEALKKAGVTTKAVFHLMKHASPYTQEGFNFYPRVHALLDNQIYGISNTALKDWPNVIIHNNETLDFEEHEDWPINDRFQKFYITPDRVGKLSINRPQQTANLDFVDVSALAIPRTGTYAQISAANYLPWKHTIIGGSNTALTSGDPFNIIQNDDRLIYLVNISEDTRISGYIKMTAKIASDKKVGGISAMLVDLGNHNYVHRQYASAGTMGSASNISTVQNYPAGSNSNGAWSASNTNLTRLAKNTQVDPWNIIARGSVSIQKPNYTGKTWIDFPETNYVPEYYYQNEVIEPGKFYPYTWELNVMDYTIKEGHKLALILYATDPEYIQRPLVNPTKFTVEVGPDTYLSLPLVGAFVTDEIPIAPLTLNAPSTLPNGTIGTVYPTQTFTASGGYPNYTYSLLSAGSLPTGLTLSVSGDLSGTPTASGTFNFTVLVTDAASDTASTDAVLTIDTAPVVTWAISASTGPNGSISPSGSVTVANGGTQAFNISPDVGYMVADVMVDGTSIGAMTSYTFSNVNANHTIAVTFVLSDSRTPQPIKDALDVVNANLNGLTVSMLSAGIGNSITELDASAPSPFKALTEPTATLPTDKVTAADSLGITLDLSQVNGDTLVLELSFAMTWADLNNAQRLNLLQRLGTVLAYEYVSPASGWAMLVGPNALLTWDDALTAGIVRFDAVGITLRCAVTDGTDALHAIGNVLVVPDGTSDGKLLDPVWLLTNKGSGNSGGGGGCNSTLLGLGLSVLLLVTWRRR